MKAKITDLLNQQGVVREEIISIDLESGSIIIIVTLNIDEEETFNKLKNLKRQGKLFLTLNKKKLNMKIFRPGLSSGLFDGNLLLEKILIIFNKLNKGQLTELERKQMRELLDNIEYKLVNYTKDDFSDDTKLILIKKLLNECKALFNNKNTERDELQAVKATFGSGGSGNYTQNPRIPNIAQFKPTGTSNIFSPIIEVKNSPMRNNNNKRYSNAYEKGFEKGLTKAQNTLGTANIIDQSTQITDTTVTKGDTTEIQGNITKYGNSSKQKGENNTGMGKNNTEMGKKSSVGNGYIKGDNNGILQKPGYSYLDPNLWDVPRKRAPICYSKGDMERKENSLDPAGFVFGGPSNVMEFHGVGSIMPKFSYEENVTEVETPGDL